MLMSDNYMILLPFQSSQLVRVGPMYTCICIHIAAAAFNWFNEQFHVKSAIQSFG